MIVFNIILFIVCLSISIVYVTHEELAIEARN